mgnify:CR=1 FL=1
MKLLEIKIHPLYYGDGWRASVTITNGEKFSEHTISAPTWLEAFELISGWLKGQEL